MKLVLPFLTALAAWPTFVRGVAPDCEALAASAGLEAGIPDGLLPAIARMEAGHSFGDEPRRAWPWTLNEGGQSHYFETRQEALVYLQAAIGRGVTNIDVGCMQINYHWHHDNFSSLDAMLDPHGNTRYGAEFLAELHRRLGSWENAVAHYHSSDDARGQSYQVAVSNIHETMTAAGDNFGQVQASSVGFMTRRSRPLIALSETVTTYLTQGNPYLDAGAVDYVEFGGFSPEVVLLSPHELSPRLEQDWPKIEAFRAILAN